MGLHGGALETDYAENQNLGLRKCCVIFSGGGTRGTHISLEVRRGTGREAWGRSCMWTTQVKATLLEGRREGEREVDTEFHALLLEGNLGRLRDQATAAAFSLSFLQPT